MAESRGVLRAIGLMALGAAGAVLGACAPYTLKGRVIEGDVSFVAVVDSADPRLESQGVAGAAVELTVNPERLNRKVVATAVTDANGAFSLPVEEVGAGFLNYDVALSARAAGYTTATGLLRLPPDSKRALIIMKPGAAGRAPANESLIDEAKRYRP